MKFYDIDVLHQDDSKYAWASGYGPINHNIDEIPFLKDAPEVLKIGFREFWEIAHTKPGIKFDSGCNEWPDILGCGGGPPHFFISERVLTDLQHFGLQYLRATEMPLIQPFPKKLREVSPPRYYVLEGIPGLESSWTAMGIPHDKDNQIDYSSGRPKPWPPSEWKVSQTSWTGLDLMSYKNWQTPMTLVCTDEIMDIAKARQWTNIQFKPLFTVP